MPPIHKRLLPLSSENANETVNATENKVVLLLVLECTRMIIGVIVNGITDDTMLEVLLLYLRLPLCNSTITQDMEDQPRHRHRHLLRLRRDHIKDIKCLLTLNLNVIIMNYTRKEDGWKR